MFTVHRKSVFRTLLPLLCLALACFRGRADQTVYLDSLQNGWVDWSWASDSLTNTSVVHTGTDSISVNAGGFQALYLHNPAFNPAVYLNLTFWINGGAVGGQPLQVNAAYNPNSIVYPPYTLSAPPGGNIWKQYTVPISALGITNGADGFWIQNASGNTLATFYVDDIILTVNPNPSPTVTLTSPSDGSSFSTPVNVNLATSVIPNGQTINSVRFYSGTNLLNSTTTQPYNFTWTNVAVGTYSVFARVIYNTTNSVDSATASITVAGPNPTNNIVINVATNRHPISPLIYGTAFAASNQLKDLNFTLNRSGGNNETRYNWQVNAHNLDFDWYFESVDDGSSVPAATADSFVANSKNGGAQPLITIPMIGWAAKLGPGRARVSSYSIAKYGPQTGNDPYWSDAGNGKSVTNSTLITSNDPTDANTNVTSAFQQSFVQHLTNSWGNSTHGGVKYYIMDNEHSIWFSTHQDIHPVGPTMQEIRNKFLDYASVVKNLDPSALVLGPEEWGWGGYLYSGYDQQWSGVNGDFNPAHYPDRGTNGGWDYMPWFLNQIHQHDTNTGVRLLDYFTLHCYPQENNVSGNAADSTTALLRNSSTRQFWDTNYVDPSWINSVIMLIPRMKGWVTNYYPGTKLGVTEYNWGAESSMNGATAQADLLGIFGRESLDLATRWTIPDAGTPTYRAMKIYRNYDGSNSTFGDTSVSAGGPNPDNVAVFAAQRTSDAALTIMVVNKYLNGNTPLSIAITNFSTNGAAHAWQLNSSNDISHLSDVSITGGNINLVVPNQSITLLVVPPPPVSLKAGQPRTDGKFAFSLNGTVGQTYIILSSPDLKSWSPVSTNTITNTPSQLLLPEGIGKGFYRAQWTP